MNQKSKRGIWVLKIQRNKFNEGPNYNTNHSNSLLYIILVSTRHTSSQGFQCISQLLQKNMLLQWRCLSEFSLHFPKWKKRKEKKKKLIFESFDFIENSHSYSFTTVESNNKESSNTWVQQTIKGIKLFPNSIYTSLQKEIQERENSKTSHHFALVQGYIGSINRK